MTESIRVDIVSAEKEIFSGEVSMVFAPAIMGEVGIAPGHAPLVTRLGPGEVRVQHADATWHDVRATAVNRLDDPAVHAIVGSFRDATVRKQHELQRLETEQILRVSEGRYRTLLDEASKVSAT